MYLVTIINSTTRTVINDVSVRIDANRITGTIKQGINCIDSFTFEIYPNNIGYNLIYPFRTLIEVYNTKKNKYEFRGRVIQQTSQMDSDGSIKKSCICESELGFLWDSIQLYGQYADFPVYKCYDILDVTDYLKIYKIKAKDFAKKLMTIDILKIFS